MNSKRDFKTPVIGIAGWKNSGKTTLVEGLVKELTGRGLRIVTVKHAHHDVRIDEAETDSARHRRAGATEVAIVAAKRWAIVHEIRNEPEPAVADVIARLSPADLVIVEGFKSEPIAKIEVRRRAQTSNMPLADRDPHVVAIAADHAIDGATLPVFDLDDMAAIADFVVHWLLGQAATGSLAFMGKRKPRHR